MTKTSDPLPSDATLYVPDVDTHLIPSTFVQQTFKIQVMRPARRRGEDRRYPVVYATDGNWTFEMFKSIAYLLQLAEEDAPPFVLVGIGYPSDSPHAGMHLRARDFTFPPFPDNDVQARPMRFEGTLLPKEGSRVVFGAEDFRDFIEHELTHFIDEEYETLPSERTYFGHSGGGFFGLFSLFTRPTLFRNYIVSSPGLVYHGDFPHGGTHVNNDFGLRMASDFIASHPKLDGKRLYLSAGSEEEFEPALMGWQVTSGVYRLARLLRAAEIPGLEVMTEIFAGESHVTAWPISFIHGVQAALGTRRVLDSVY